MPVRSRFHWCLDTAALILALRSLTFFFMMLAELFCHSKPTASCSCLTCLVIQKSVVSYDKELLTVATFGFNEDEIGDV